MIGIGGTSQRDRSVDRRWPERLWDQDGRSRWRLWNGRQYGYFVAVGALFAVAYIDVSLLLGRGEPWFPSSLLHQSRQGLWVLAALLAANALALDGYLAARGAPFLRLPLGLRFVRLLLCGLPVLGLVLIPLAACWGSRPGCRGHVRTATRRL